MATAATLNTDVDAARDAMIALDWQTALNLLLPVKLVLSTRPDTMVGSSGGMRYNAVAIDTLIDNCRAMLRQQAAASNVSSGTPFFVDTPIRYVRG